MPAKALRPSASRTSGASIAPIDLPRQLDRRGVASQPGPEDAGGGPLERAQQRLRRGRRQEPVAARTAGRHHLGLARLEDRLEVGGDGDGRVAGAGPDRRPRGHLDGAGQAPRPAGDRHLAGAELGRVRAAPGRQPEDGGLDLPADGRRRGAVRNPDRRPPAARRCATSRARPGGRAWPAWKLTVIAASTAGPSTSPLEASTPEAMSQATTGAPQRPIASIAAAAGSRAAPEKPVPKIASTTAPDSASRAAGSPSRGSAGKRSRLAAASPLSSAAGPEQQRLDLVPGLGQIARRDQPVAGVVALAAHDPDRALGRELADRRRDLASGGLHQLERGHPALLDRPGVDRAHPARVVEGIQPGLHRGAPADATRR